MLTIHDSMAREKRAFVPENPGDVRMYVCGPTVYDRAHLGNARPAVVFDVLFRLLRHLYGADHVTYVRNITDVDDKINARAAETGRPIRDITEETVGWYREDMGALGVLPPTHEPRATEHIGGMIEMIEGLIERGHAYAAEGHVLFSVSSYSEYGKLSGRSVEDMIAGARVEVAPYKRDPMDFVLWKPSDEDTPGWDSPWGRGRPGWHIECSAMSAALLGESFDIHGGGQDLKFPHHENEIAQSACAHPGAAFARHWMHNEMLLVEGRKMSKSLGNFFTVRDLLDRGVPGEVIRMVLLGTHYRKPMDWTEERVAAETKRLTKWKRAASVAQKLGVYLEETVERGGPISHPGNSDKPFMSEMVVGMLKEDLNTKGAIDGVSIQADYLLRWDAGDMDQPVGWAEATAHRFVNGLWLVGLEGIRDDSDVVQGSRAMLVSELLRVRSTAKNNKDFATADAIRDGLRDAGIMIRDTSAGSEWDLSLEFDGEIVSKLAKTYLE